MRIFTALITPFNQDLSVDTNTFGRLVSQQSQDGVESLVIAGSTGEGLFLTLQEKKGLISVAQHETFLSLIVGVTGHELFRIIEESLHLLDMGIDCVMITPPYYVSMDEDDLIDFYSRISDAKIRFMAYHHPKRTGAFFSDRVYDHLAKLACCVGIKDAYPTSQKNFSVFKESSKPIYSGNDGFLSSPSFIDYSGIISVVTNLIPRLYQSAVNGALQGKVDPWKKIQPVVDTLSHFNNPKAIKHLLTKYGTTGVKQFCRFSQASTDFKRLDLVVDDIFNLRNSELAAKQ